MTTTHPTWPDDEDGDVLRMLEENDFDFSKVHLIDFFIEFDEWPPSEEAMEVVTAHYPEVEVNEDEGEGYLSLKCESLVTYEFVVGMQNEITSRLAQYNGRCEAWGVLQS